MTCFEVILSSPIIVCMKSLGDMILIILRNIFFTGCPVLVAHIKYALSGILFFFLQSCAVANLYREYYVYEGDTVSEVWKNVHYW